MTEVRIPKLGVSMEEAELVEWYVDDGDQVDAGQVIYGLASEKVEMDVEAPAAGVISVQGATGTVYAVGDLVATIS